MKPINYFILFGMVTQVLTGMDDPRQIPQEKPGIFLDQIVSEYQNPVRISQLPLAEESFTQGGCKNYSCREDLPDRIQHLAVVAGGQAQFINREIKPDVQNGFGNNGFYCIETACLRVEDLSSNSKKTFIWLYRKVTNSDQKNKRKVWINRQWQTVETLEFDSKNALSTLISLRFTDKNYLQGMSGSRVEFTSKTNTFLDPILKKLMTHPGGDL